MSRPVLHVLGLTLLSVCAAACADGAGAPDTFEVWSPEAVSAASEQGRPVLIDAYGDG